MGFHCSHGPWGPSFSGQSFTPDETGIALIGEQTVFKGQWWKEGKF